MSRRRHQGLLYRDVRLGAQQSGVGWGGPPSYGLADGLSCIIASLAEGAALCSIIPLADGAALCSIIASLADGAALCSIIPLDDGAALCSIIASLADGAALCSIIPLADGLGAALAAVPAPGDVHAARAAQIARAPTARGTIRRLERVMEASSAWAGGDQP
jgi:hypothetical protein